MIEPNSDDAASDPFGPPKESVEVCCLHCGQTYFSGEILWEQRTCHDGHVRGFWVCPIEGCDGAGFGFDILPTDPDYQDERGGWVYDDEDEDEAFDDDGLELDLHHEWDPDDDSDPEFPTYDPDEPAPF